MRRRCSEAAARRRDGAAVRWIGQWGGGAAVGGRHVTGARAPGAVRWINNNNNTTAAACGGAGNNDCTFGRAAAWAQVLHRSCACSPLRPRAADSLIICGCWERLACVSLVGCGGRSGVGLEWGGMSVFGVSRMLLVAGNSCVFGVLLLAACPCAAALGRAPGAGAPAGRPGPPPGRRSPPVPGAPIKAPTHLTTIKDVRVFLTRERMMVDARWSDQKKRGGLKFEI